jgi:hypothetical protein
MGIKELSLIKYVFLIVCVFNFGCSQPKEGKTINSFEQVDVSQIPNDTILQNSSTLSLQNGVYYIGSKPYSGFIKDVYETDTLKSIGSYFQGKQHGTTKTFFPNGKLETKRNYRNGIGYGQHLGYWKNGNIILGTAPQFKLKQLVVFQLLRNRCCGRSFIVRRFIRLNLRFNLSFLKY